MKKYSKIFVIVLITSIVFLVPEFAYASVETTLTNFGNAFGGRIIPLFAILGLCYAAFGFVTGNPGAKTHLIYAIVGVGVGLCSKSIVEFVMQLAK